MNSVINKLLRVKEQVQNLQANQKKVRVKIEKHQNLSSGFFLYHEPDPVKQINWIISDIENGYLQLIETLRKKAKVRKPKRQS